MTDENVSGEEVARLRAEVEELKAEMAHIRARLDVELIVLGSAATQPPAPRPKLRLIKGGLVGVAIVGALGWGRSHPATLVAAFVAAVAAVATWWLWPGDDPSPAGEPPGRQPAVTVTVTSSLTARPTATRTSPARTITTIEPTTVLTIEPTTVLTIEPRERTPVPTISTATPTIEPTEPPPTATPTRTPPPLMTPPPIATERPGPRFCVRVRLDPLRPLVCVRTPPLPSQLW